MKNASRVLKANGILFLSIPDKETNFDRNRAVTSFTRLRNDYFNGPESSKIDHFDDFVSFADLEGIGSKAWTTEDDRMSLINKLI